MRRLGLLLVLLAILIDVAQSTGNVNAAFKLDPEEYTKELADPYSAEYKALVERIMLEVGIKIPGFEIVFFGPGSEVDSDGKADSVIVYARVTTNENKKDVKRKLKQSKINGLVKKSVSVGVRICNAGYQANNECINMKNDYTWFNNFIICVEARDRYECIQWLKEDKVDVVRGDVEAIYLANEMYGDALSVVAETRDEDKKDDICKIIYVAVVRRSTITNGLDSLKGSKFCSTGYDEICGWWVPLSKLLEKDELKFSGNGSVLEQNIEAFSSYFGEACLPGQWGPIEGNSNDLKTKYRNLCSLCNTPEACMAPIGREGALQCLNSGGDVAWDTLEAVEEFTFPNPEDFGFLCLDGSIEDLDSSNPCVWSREPWPGWLIRADEEEAGVIVSTLRKAANKAQRNNPIKGWAKDVLGITSASVIKKLNPPLSPYVYLNHKHDSNEGGYYITINKPGYEGVPVRFCVTTEIALQKCTELAQVLKSQRVRPLLTCVKENDCTLAIVNGRADIVTLDGGDVFTEYNKDQTIPVLSEVYGKHDASYFAVAVVRADADDITSLASLKGKDSCHTGIDKTAGWNMPLISLIEKGQVIKAECDYPGQIGRFFNESCAPGALDPKYDPDNTNPHSLCDLCIGNDAGQYKCARDDNERFYGYSGAFRCLVQGGGDVAFVKHTTVPDNTDGHGDKDWNENLDSNKYRLLCKNGTKVKVEDYENCNLAKVPSHMVVTGYNAGDVLLQDIRTLLLSASETLPPGNDVFVMFGDYGTYHDILFKNSATSLINLSEDAFDDLTKGSYWKALEALEECDE